jgi:hypothetical protein
VAKRLAYLAIPAAVRGDIAEPDSADETVSPDMTAIPAAKSAG